MRIGDLNSPPLASRTPTRFAQTVQRNFGNFSPLPVLWRCWLGRRKGIRPVKNWVVGCWRGYLGWGADLHIAQQMPLPLTISCSSKSRLVLPFLVLPFWYMLTRVVPDKLQKSNKTTVCVCVCLPSPKYTQSSASTKLLNALKLHPNLQIFMTCVRNYPVALGPILSLPFL